MCFVRSRTRLRQSSLPGQPFERLRLFDTEGADVCPSQRFQYGRISCNTPELFRERTDIDAALHIELGRYEGPVPLFPEGNKSHAGHDHAARWHINFLASTGFFIQRLSALL